MVNMNFFFDYIYYRVTQVYFKWDGRTGGTAIAAITLFQLITLMDLFLLINRFVNDTNIRYGHPIERWIFIAVAVALLIFNYKKYNKSYNKYRYYWKDESKVKRFYKGIFVIISLMAPWLIAFWIGLS